MEPPSSADFLRIAHRGASAECPENTLVAFRRGVEQSAQMVECDLQLSADGHVVVIHDSKLDRTTDGSGPVAERTFAELRALDAGSWRDPRFAGERLPTVEEALDVVLPRAQMNLELKCRGGGSRVHRLALAAVGAVGQRDAFASVVFSSFDVEAIQAVRDVSPYAQIGILWSVPPFEMAWELARELGAVSLNASARAISRETVAAAHDHGLEVLVWTVNDVDRMVDLVAMGVDGIFSDYPGRLLEARSRLLRRSG